MHILLPPSETKRSGGAAVFAPGSLAHDTELRDARISVRAALVELSGDASVAAKALKLGVKNLGEIDRNIRLETSGAMPAIERYTGVLYDALDAPSLDAGARRWLDEHVSVQSALFGLIGAGDQIPAYRLSASSRLPALRAPLKNVWREAHAGIKWPSLGLVLDLRSKDYVALAPLPKRVGVWVQVVQRSESGEIRALNHFNKAAKGDLVRRLALSGTEIESLADLLRWGAAEGIEITVDAEESTLTLVTSLGAPKTTGSAG